jgi:DnaJ-class molecular chaperone
MTEEMNNCPECQGLGQVVSRCMNCDHGLAYASLEYGGITGPCVHCNGTGVTMSPCPTCGGHQTLAATR